MQGGNNSSVGTTHTNDGFQTGEKIVMLMSSATHRKRTQAFKKVCLTAFAESEFGNP